MTFFMPNFQWEEHQNLAFHVYLKRVDFRKLKYAKF